MKKLFLLLVLTTCFAWGKMNAQTVYVTDNGKKYHARNCDVAKTGKKGVELSEAKKQGYEACKVCKPKEVKSEGKSKEVPQSKNKK